MSGPEFDAQEEADLEAADEATEVAELEAKHARIVAESARKYEMLQTKFGVMIAPDAIEQKRLTFIIDQLFPPGTVKRMNLEIKWQEWFAAQLEEIHADILRLEREAKTKIVVPEKSLIVPGRG